jgi:hypothetical protein
MQDSIRMGMKLLRPRTIMRSLRRIPGMVTLGLIMPISDIMPRLMAGSIRLIRIRPAAGLRAPRVGIDIRIRAGIRSTGLIDRG